MFGLEELFDLNKDGRLDALERASMHEFLQEDEKRSGKRNSRFDHSRFDDTDDINNRESEDF